MIMQSEDALCSNSYATLSTDRNSMSKEEGKEEALGNSPATELGKLMSA